MKRGSAFPLNHIICCNRRLLSSFQTKHFFLIQCFNIAIGALVHRALMICTKRRLNEEIERNKKILLNNGYPKNIINAQITKKIVQFSTLKQFGPEKCPVYLRVP